MEHDPREILESVKVCITKALDKATADGFNVDGGLSAIGITNQRETTLVWSKSTGNPLYNAIVWMDVRTSSICRQISTFDYLFLFINLENFFIHGHETILSFILCFRHDDLFAGDWRTNYQEEKLISCSPAGCQSAHTSVLSNFYG